MNSHHAITLVAAVLLAQTADMSPSAREYLTKALDLVQANALTRDRVDWPAVRSRAFDLASRAQTPAETHDAIRSVIAALGDRHRSFQTRASMEANDRRAAPMAPPPSGSLIDGRLAHVVVPPCCIDRDATARYATILQDVLRSLDTPTTCGWIVDLRKNMGGSMWPMLAGIGPLLTDGPLGSFVGPGGDSAAWSYDNGVAKLGTRELARTSNPPYRLRQAPHIAVLLSAETASSGEAVAIAFRANPNTRSFGQRTKGLTSANGTFALSDGAMIILAQASEVDREGRGYEDGVPPDVVTDEVENGVPMAARRWLLDQTPCPR